MQCPTCGQKRKKRCWYPSQWKSCGPVTDHFTQCKVCSGDISHENWWEAPGGGVWRFEFPRPATPPPPTQPPAAAVRRMPDFPDDDLHLRAPEALELVEIAARLRLDEFINAWMQLPRRTRKDFSYNGAVKSRYGDPVHYKCPFTGQIYFDAMNKVYSWTLSIMCPLLMEAMNWNREMHGDICESVMGAHYEWSITVPRTRPEMLGTISPEFGRNLKFCSELIDTCSWLTFCLYRRLEYSDEKMITWVHWIIEIVSWRKQITTAVNIAQEPQMETGPVSPREKSKGSLVLGISNPDATYLGSLD